MKVVHVTSVHPANDPRIFYKEAMSLSAAGHDVCVIAARGPRPEHTGSVEVLILPQPRSRLERFVVTIPQIVRAALSWNGDIYHFHDPELIPGMILLRLLGKKVILDLHEDVVEQVLSKRWIHRSCRRIVSTLMGLLVRAGSLCASGLVFATPGIAAIYGINGRAHATVQNFPRLEEFRTSFHSHNDEPMAVVYAGGLSPDRGISELVDAIEIVNKKTPVTLLLAGAFQSREFQDLLVRKPGWKHVQYYGYVDRGALLTLYTRASVGIVVLHPLLNYVNSQPTKMYEYMAAGLAILASDFPAWRDVVVGNQCGRVVEPGKAQDLANAIVQMCENRAETQAMGRRGRQALIRNYTWSSQETVLNELYSQVGGGRVHGAQ